jgi:predicted permease
MTVVNSLAPIVIVIALGALLRATRFLSEDFFNGMNKLTFWVGLPALLFHKVAEAQFQGDAALGIAWVLFAGTGACIIVAYAGALALRLPRKSVGSFVQGSFRGNLVYVGLPVILYALAQSGADSAAIESTAIIAIAPVVPVYNIVSVLILSLHGSSGQRPSIRSLAAQLATNPLILACVLGLAVCLGGIGLPTAASRSLHAVGQIALPLALLAIGSSLTFERLRGSVFAASLVTFVKVVVGPAAGYAVARWLGLDAVETCIALVFLACPTATASYVMAQQMGADETLSGSAVVISTLASLIPLAVVVCAFS